jgi:3-dehydroquinate synthase
MSEAVKVALIRDAAFFRWMEESASLLAAGDADAVEHLVRRCAELHLAHIATSGDPFEMGSARPLDFGHWAAHKLESLTHSRLRHGEAVAIGVALDALYSAEIGYIDTTDAERVVRLLQRLGFHLWDHALEAPDAAGHLGLLDGLTEFREHLGGELTVTLLGSIGKGVEVHEMDPALVQRALLRLREQSGAG